MSDNADKKPEGKFKLYACPECGSTEWIAEYYQAVTQGCSLVMGENGILDAEDYDGCEDSCDDGGTENDAYKCSNCNYRFLVGRFRFIPFKKPRVERF